MQKSPPVFRVQTYENGLPEAAMRIRLAVFCDEQGYLPHREFDQADQAALHVLLYEGEEAVATGRILQESGQVFYLGRIAVLKPWRGRKAGRFLMETLMDIARSRGAKTFKLGAQVQAKGFYEKLGFRVVGDIYPDDHVAHVPMERPA
ncbi:MAG: GNAT family N-acetyltransferase [Clostridiales bacterium]|nr:GNAT family N-acetyltransferase [Clostridiales bacterium]